MAVNSARAAVRSSTISRAMTSGDLARSARTRRRPMSARPSYFEGMRMEPAPVSDIRGARVLAKLDSVTTDHITPAGAIKVGTPAAQYLRDNSRRGNHEVIIGMGVLPLQFADGQSAASLGLTGTETFDIVGVERLNEGETRVRSRCARTVRSSPPSSGSTPRARRTTTATAASCSTYCATSSASKAHTQCGPPPLNGERPANPVQPYPRTKCVVPLGRTGLGSVHG
jgi:aconitase A